jgi:hypothetical protein
MNGGHRFIVSSSRELIALKALVGIALSQSGTPRFAGTGGGSFPSSSAGQRNLSVTGSCLLRTALFFVGSPVRSAFAPLV